MGLILKTKFSVIELVLTDRGNPTYLPAHERPHAAVEPYLQVEKAYIGPKEPSRSELLSSIYCLGKRVWKHPSRARRNFALF